MSNDEESKRKGPRTPPIQYRTPPKSDSESPSPKSRKRPRSQSPEDRRDRSRRRGHSDDGRHFSNYYRSRFGSQSPEEYQNLRVTNIDPKVSNDDLLEALEKMKRYGDLHVKIVNQRDPYERIAYVNFERAQDARDARKGQLQKLVAALGTNLSVDPAGVRRDQEGNLISSNGPSIGYRSREYGDRGRWGGGGGYYRGGGYGEQRAIEEQKS